MVQSNKNNLKSIDTISKPYYIVIVKIMIIIYLYRIKVTFIQCR